MQYFKPKQKYYDTCLIRNRYYIPSTYEVVLINCRNNYGDPEKAEYPHRYYVISHHTEEILVYAVRYTEYGDFFLYGDLVKQSINESHMQRKQMN